MRQHDWSQSAHDMACHADLQGEFQAAKADFQALDTELKAHRQTWPGKAAAYLAARDLQAGS